MLSKAKFPGLSRKARRTAAAQSKLVRQGKPVIGTNYVEIAMAYQMALKNWFSRKVVHNYVEPYPGFTAAVRRIHAGKAGPGEVVA